MGGAGQGARLGLMFSGGPAPGGQNVALGMLECLLRCNGHKRGDGEQQEPGGHGGHARRGHGFVEREGTNQLIGFVGGPLGLVEKRQVNASIHPACKRR